MGGFFGGGGGAAASNMVGATSSAAGAAGLVPAPAAGDQERFLSGGATFTNDFLPNNGSPSFDTTAAYFRTGAPTSFVNGFINVIYLLPVFIPKRIVNPTIFFRCTGHSVAGTQGVKALVYSNSASLPYSLLYNSGEIVIAQAAANYSHSTSNFTMERGIYWAGLVRSATSMGFLSINPVSNFIIEMMMGCNENTAWTSGPTCVGHDSSYTTPATTLPTSIRLENVASTSTYLTAKPSNGIWIGIR